MKRLVHLGLLLIALLGVIGQSTAMAMMPASLTAISADRSIQVSMAGMDCMEMADGSIPGQSPCKKVTLQCMAAMGYAQFALNSPPESPADLPVDDCTASLPSLTARLWGRSYGPEPDPPSFLI